MQAMIAVLQRLLDTDEGNNETDPAITSRYPRPEVAGVVLREIDDESLGDDPGSGKEKKEPGNDGEGGNHGTH